MSRSLWKIVSIRSRRRSLEGSKKLMSLRLLLGLKRTRTASLERRERLENAVHARLFF
jgi:hypothetical protein